MSISSPELRICTVLLKNYYLKKISSFIKQKYGTSDKRLHSRVHFHRARENGVKVDFINPIPHDAEEETG